MTTGLGTTSDPATLVPGSPSGIVDIAQRFADRARSARSVGDSLRRIDTGSWIGTAHDTWREAHDSDIPRWMQAADSLDAAAEALRAHAEVLTWAQRRAGDAASTWSRSIEPDDPARQAAVAMLDDARRQVRESALRSAEILNSEAETAPQDSQKQADANFYGGIWDSVYNAGAGAVRAVTDPVGAVGSAIDAATHPVQTAKDMVAWDDWASGHGDRALGRVTGSVGLALGSYGVAKGASVLGRRVRGGSDVDGPDPATGTPPAPASERLQPAIDYATREPKMDHVFVPKHKLDPLVHRFGDRHAAMVEIVRRLGAGNDLPTSGPFEVVRQIEGQPVHIRGAVVDGTPKIGTVFTP